MTKLKWFVGLSGIGRNVFACQSIPTESSHGHLYQCCIGPFVTKRGAEFMCKFGRGNPHCQSVHDAEKLSRRIGQ